MSTLTKVKKLKEHKVDKKHLKKLGVTTATVATVASAGNALIPSVASANEITPSVVSTEVSSVENDGSVTLGIIEEDQPTIFYGVDSQDDLINQIDSNYENSSQGTPGSGLGISYYAAPGTTWGKGTVVYDNNGGYYVTDYHWVKGSNMGDANVVTRAQYGAVKAKYGSVSKNTSYKMKTKQHIVPTLLQKHGYWTISAQAWCYGR